MRKYIIATIIAASLLIPVTAKKVVLDYNQLASTASEKDIKTAYKQERSLFYKTYYDNKETFLQLCLKNDRPYSFIKMCIDYESDINATSKDGRNPVSYAAQYSSDPRTIEILVKTDALTASRKRKRITQTDSYGKNAFHYAKENANGAIYAKLCEFSEDPNVYEGDEVATEKNAPLDDIAALEAELAREAAELEAMSYKGPEEVPAPVPEPAPVVVPVPAPPVEAPAPAVAEEKEEITEEPEVVALIEKAVATPEPVPVPAPAPAPVPVEAPKPDLKKQEVETYASAFLLDYAEEPKEEAAEKKIIKIENPNLADKNGVTLLMKAAKSGSDWDVRTLLASGAEVNARDKDGWTALMYAARYQNNLNIINMLIEKGAYVRVRNKFNATPLLMAADYSKNPEILSVLLKNRTVAEDEVFRAFVFCITGKTSTTHVRAAKVKLFLDMNIPLNRLWKGQTPLMYAAQYSTSTDVIQQLLDAGADPALTNEKGMSAFDYAKNNKRLPQDNTFWALNSAK
ncbi:MAG: ankyrin repeat domain-containing protein [Spirochaetales bacterium]|nr:ankyrin repeat domain-containing protein [Spirochaetales bacterium]